MTMGKAYVLMACFLFYPKCFFSKSLKKFFLLTLMETTSFHFI